MIVDSRSIPLGSRIEADLCIVGAGAAGISIAQRFAGTSTRVVVLESGGEAFEATTQDLSRGENVGLPYFPLDTARLRWLGGTTNHWGGICRPMDPEDFESKAWIPNSGWPIAERDLESYYEPARVMCGVSSGDWGLETWRQRDRFKPLPVRGDRLDTRIAQIVSPETRSFRITHRAGIQAARNVVLQCHANVTEIETNSEGTLATLFHVATLDGNRYTVAARQGVLAAGGIENPRILLASNRQWHEGVGNRNDLVGRFFLEHPRFVGGVLVPFDRRLSVGLYDHHKVGAVRLLGYLGLKQATRDQEQLVDVQMSLHPTLAGSFQRSAESEDMKALHALVPALRQGHIHQLGGHLARVAEDLTSWQALLIPGAPLPAPFPEVVGKLMRSTPFEAQALIPDLMGDIAARGYAKKFGAPIESILLRTRINAVPNPDSRVTLGDDRDPLGIPRVRLDWRLTSLDRHSVRRSLEVLGSEVGRAGLGRVRVMLDDNDGPWPEDLAGGWHHMGTTRMADDPRRGVVDRNCRVHGIRNLYIAGSSVFPTAGSGTPTLTIVALALRLADHLKGLLA